jgi:hypothetical protein
VTGRRAKGGLGRFVFISSCMVGTIVMVSLTRQWIEVAFFASFFLLGFLRWFGPAPPRQGTDSGLRRQLSIVDAGFWVVILGAAVTQLWTPTAASAPIIVWWVRFITVLAWSTIGRKRRQPG